MPLISVILPVYNTEKYIAEAVQSVLDQTLGDFELLVINDASTDNTLHILQQFKDERLKIINNETNLKVVKSLNKGLELANGEFIARMDADDICYPERFQKQIQYFKDHPEVDVCGTWVHAFGADNFLFTPYEKHEDIKANLLFLNIIIHPSVIYRKSSLNRYGLIYDESFINAEDYGLWADGIDNLQFANLPEILLKYRIHPNNRSGLQNQISPVLKEMNFKAYRNIFQKSGIHCNDKQLGLHIHLAFRMIKDLPSAHFSEYLKWLKLIVLTNNNNHYFKNKSLRNVILHEFIYLIKKAKKTPSMFFKAINFLIRIYTIHDYIQFLKYRSKRLNNSYNSCLKPDDFIII